MRIAFADFSEMDFHALSVEQMPMGGSQSAACCLARSLAAAGHAVTLLGNCSAPGTYGGVTSVAWAQAGPAELRGLKLDAMVCLLTPDNGVRLRHSLGTQVKLVLWNQHAHDHVQIQPLWDPRAQGAFDGFAMVSHWQRAQYLSEFRLDPARMVVLRNAIAPAFANLFPNHSPILPEKVWPPILAYTSTPFRGLNLLLDAFPAIRQAIPGTRLEVYSSMKVYQVAAAEDQARYGELYQRCRETDGVDYVGSLPQPELAQRLRRVTMLAYPNTYAETSCMAVMEAMAAGCRVVTSHLGALPETTAGFGRLIPVRQGPEAYLAQFIEQVIIALQEGAGDPGGTEARLRAQVNKVNAADTWSIRAGEWHKWLAALPTGTRRKAGTGTPSLEMAMQHHQSGRPLEAEQIYRQILAQQPNHADALHLLGVIAYQIGKNDLAVELIRQAIALKPDYPDAQNNLGTALKNGGHMDQAIAAYRQAIALRPSYAEAHYNLGNALNAQARLDEAILAYRQALAVKPNLAEAHYNLGNVLQAKDRPDEAILAYRQAIVLKPKHVQAHYSLGTVLKARGRLDEAIAAWRQAVALNPQFAQAYGDLGAALKDKGQLDDSITAYRQALVLKPDDAALHYYLGTALQAAGRVDEVVAAYRQAIALKPDFPEAYSNLAVALQSTGQMDEAIAACRQAITLKADLPEAYNNLGIGLNEQGRLDEAIAAYRQAITLDPEPVDSNPYSNLLFALYHHPHSDARQLLEETRQWARRQLVVAPGYSPNRDRNPGRKLKVGYLSPYFVTSAEAYFVYPLLANHDHRRLEIHCYSRTKRHDDFSQRLQTHGDHWEDISHLGIQEAVQRLRRQELDILVNVSQAADKGLSILASRIAPIQVAWLVFGPTTGLETMDYRISDPYADPPGMDEGWYAEQTVRLPETAWCYDPLADVPSADALPALANGFVTFGSLNRFSKINSTVVAAWVQILRGVPHSRLHILAVAGSARESFLDQFQQAGVDRGRIELIDRLPRPDYLRQYHRLDLMLDTFPYSGHTTVCDALWMGVPVVTCWGHTPVGRVAASALRNLSLGELIGPSPAEYVRIAVQLAHDLPRLQQLRSTLRQRMEASPLMDAPRFAGNVEAAYRQMWQQWCAI